MHQNDLLDESQNETVSRMGQSTDSCVADILCDDSTIEVNNRDCFQKIIMPMIIDQDNFFYYYLFSSFEHSMEVVIT